MRVIITGGSGLIGRALSAELVGAGHEVIVLSRNPPATQGLAAGVKVQGWDGRTAQGWGHLADGAGAIVNLAGESIAGENLLKMRWTAKRKQGILQSRLNAGKAVVEAVQAAKVKPAALIQASAVGYYGVRNLQPLDERAPAGNDFLAEVCQQWEASTQAVEAAGVRRVVTRLGVVLSTQGGALPLQALPFRLFAGGPIGSGKQGYPWIHIRDVVGALRFLIETPAAQGVFNLSGPALVDNAAFGKALGRALRRPALIPTPGFVFQLAFGEAATILLDGQLVQPRRLQELGYKFQFTDPDAALSNLFRA